MIRQCTNLPTARPAAGWYPGFTMTMIDATKARLREDTQSARIGLFGCTTEGAQGDSGEAVNERGELFNWWLYPDGELDVCAYRADEIDHDDLLTDPEYLAARAEVGL